MNSPSPRDRSRIGFVAAGALFLLALLLPAYDEYNGMPGWECAYFVLFTFFHFDPTSTAWLYYSAFNLTNLALLVLPIMALLKRSGPFPGLTPWIIGACLLHTASWMFHKRGAPQAGYYVWLLAVGVLFAACLIQVRSQNSISETTH